MPAGVVTVVEDGFALIDFVDPAQRGPGLQRLISLYGAEIIETLTRSGPRRIYRVPEGNARGAGLIDEPEPPLPVTQPSVVRPVPKPVPSVTYDDGKPDADWSRAALDAYAVRLGISDAARLPNKQAVLSAIRAIEA